MQKDWFPFFSMLFWFFTKLVGLGLCLSGLTSLVAMFAVAFHFWTFLLAGLIPIGIGGMILGSEILYDLGTGEMRRRLTVTK